MEKKKRIHIVSFDVPYPANYGGAIDVFVRMKALIEHGFSVVLHCFEYGRGQSDLLQTLADKVYYYDRQSLFFSLFSLKPMIVKSRENKKLLENLLEDSAPILFEGQHTTAFLSHKDIRNRVKILRLHNVETDYYGGLARSEDNFFKKMFFYLESYKLKRHEHIFKYADALCAISFKDKSYYDTLFSNVKLLPIANELSFCTNVPTKNFVLFHGNLSVVENEYALLWFLDGFEQDLPFRLVVAGKSPSARVKNVIASRQNITLIDSPSDEKMSELVSAAKVHLVLTFQATGVKQKLLNVLSSRGCVVVNSLMVEGTSFDEFCVVASSHTKLLFSLLKCLNEPIQLEQIAKRHEYLEKNYSKQRQVEVISKCIRENENKS